MKNFDKNTFKVKGARKAIQSLALVIGLSSILASASIGGKQTSIINQNSSIQVEHDHDCDCEFLGDEIVVETVNVNNEEYYANNNKTIEVKEFTQKETKVEDDNEVTIDGYMGSSIVEALASNGYDSSFSFRKDLAIKLGITDYTGSAEQNIKMLDILSNKANNELQAKKAKETKISSVRIQEIASYIATIEGQTFNNDKQAYNWAVKNNILAGKYNYSLNRQDLSNVLMSYASFKGVNINNIDYKLGMVTSVFKDNKKVTNNINNLARAYYFGYIDVDANNNINGNKIISASDVDYAFRNLINDINIAILNKSYDESGKLIIKPNVDKYSKDSKDATGINAIRNYNEKKPENPSTPVENNNNGNNNNNNNDNNDNKPSPEDDDIKPVHKHSYGAWYAKNDQLEERKCSCGKTEHRNHSYGDWYQKDATTEERECSTCGRKMTRPMEDTHTHTYDEWESYDDTYERRYCNHAGCNHYEERSHSYQTPVLTYSDNNNGTHHVVTKETCSTCSHTHIINVNDEACNYGGLSYSSDSSTTHKVSEICSDCNHVNEYTEDCSFGQYTYDAAAGVDVAHCTKCSNTDEKAHEHNYGSWNAKDENECERVCEDCEQPQTQPHNYVDKGTYYECSDCGYQKQKTQHTHNTATKYEGHTNDANSICCYEVVYCIDPSCGEEISRIPIDHDWKVLDEDDFEILYGCRNCSATKSEEKELPLMMMMSAPQSAPVIIEEEPEDILDPEDQEQLPEDPVNQEQHPENEQETEVIDQIIEEVIQEIIEEQQENNFEEPSQEGSKTLELIP